MAEFNLVFGDESTLFDKEQFELLREKLFNTKKQSKRGTGGQAMRLGDLDALRKVIEDRQRLLESDNERIWKANKPYFKGLAYAHRLILDAPTIDPEELRPKGRWLLDGRCSNCLENPLTTHKDYCPNCGAKMEDAE